MATKTAPVIPSSSQLVGYFFRLGAMGFGGPVALTAAMRADLVEARGWITDVEYRQGMTLAQLAPGPLAAQLAIYIGWVRGGTALATAVAVAFVLPSFLIVLCLSYVYVRYGGLSWIPGVFYGVGAAVIAVIARSAYKLARTLLARDSVQWAIFGVSAVITVTTQSEVMWVFLAGGLVTLLSRRSKLQTGGPMILAAAVPPSLGFATPVASGLLLKLFLFFAGAGAFVFGSGLAIVPFLHGNVVQEFGWLNERQFLDAVAIAMITPGPVVITVAFIGYLVAGTAGAVVASLGVFLPCYLLVVIPAKHFNRIVQKPQVHNFVDGVTAAATGAIAGAAIVLGQRAITDVTSVIICAITLLLLLRANKIPEQVLILAAGIAGIWLYG
jgi:chromate transporter